MMFLKTIGFDGEIRVLNEEGFDSADIFMARNDKSNVAVVPRDGLPYTVEILTKHGTATLNYLHYNVETLKPVERNGCVTLEDFTVFMDFLCIIKDADNEDVQNLIARAFMKSAEIRNKLSDRKDPQPIPENIDQET